MKANKVLIDLKQHAKQFDNLAMALDAPRAAGSIQLARKRFAELTESMRKDAKRRGSFQKQSRFSELYG